VWNRKIRVVDNALTLHNPDPNSAIDVLSKVGGFEIGGIAGAILVPLQREFPLWLMGLYQRRGLQLRLGSVRM
jgi:nicotinate-nucleotide--dimethylbenzimidazole phosphoribosyltransferase